MFGYQALRGDITTYAARNSRRQCFYAYPEAAATLTGIMSLTDSEETDGPSFDWWEKRNSERRAVTTDFTAGSAGPWQDSGGTGGASVTYIVGSTARLKITSNDNINNWKVGEGIMIHRQRVNGSDAYADVRARITAIDATNSVLTLYMDTAIVVDNTATTYSGASIRSLGVAYAEGSGVSSGHRSTFPCNPGNYTQIFKTTKSWTATVLKQPLYFDAEGPGAKGIAEATRDHLIQLENAMLFGERSSNETVDPVTGDTTIVRRTGGLLWFLEQYEAVNGGTFTYRPNGSALTSNSDDEKRIITTDSTRTLSAAVWSQLEERMFRRTLTSTQEKLVIGGHAFIRAILSKYRNGVQVNRDFKEEYELAFHLQTIQTDYGTLHVKAHPRFNDDPELKFNGFVVDVAALKFRPMVDRDTHIKPNVQDKKVDGREDLILTEAGLEVRFPESCMYFKGVSTISS